MSDHYTSADDDQKWIMNLARTVPGRHLDDHNKCVNFSIVNKYRSECPMQQVSQFRRVFMRSFADNDRCCGLPRPTPPFVAIVNLSGYRSILYSKRSALIRLLCLVGPDASERVMRNVEQVLQYGVQHNCTVLCCLSLPWQAGVQAVHWEVRSIERKPDGAVRDGAMCYIYGQEEVRTVASTCDTDFCDAAQMRAQMEAMRTHFAACNLDLEVDDDEQEARPSSPGAEDLRFEKLKGVVNAVKADRARILGELDAEKTDHAAKLAEKDRACEERIATIVNKAKIATDVAQKKVMELEKHNSTLREQNAALEKKNANLTREKATQDLEFDRERASLTTKANLQGMSAKSASEKLSALNKSSERERTQLEKGHVKVVEALEKRLHELQLDSRRLERTLEDRAGVTNRLEGLVDQMRTEKQALNYETISRRRKIIGLQCALAIASLKHDNATAVMTAMTRESASLLAGQQELQQMLGHAEGAAHTAEEALQIMSKEMDKMKKELEAEKKKKRPKEPPTPPPPAPPPPKPATADAENQTAPMKSKVDEELEELSERFVKLQEEKAAQDTELELLRTQQVAVGDQIMAPSAAAVGDPMVKQQTYNHSQVFNQVVVPGGNNWQQSPLQVDLGVDPNGDSGVEALVAQMQLSMRAVVDMARQGHQHKHAADNMWSELQAIKRFTGAGMDGGAWGVAPANGYYETMVQPMAHWVQTAPYANGQQQNGHGLSGRNRRSGRG